MQHARICHASYCRASSRPLKKRSAAGSIEPEIVVHRLHADQPIKCVAAARQLARAIMAAANEIDGLT
jgi:hypothetical protein